LGYKTAFKLSAKYINDPNRQQKLTLELAQAFSAIDTAARAMGHLEKSFGEEAAPQDASDKLRM